MQENEKKPLSIRSKISLRNRCNFLLDNIVNLHLSLFPDLRYIQNLWALGIIDDRDKFNEEPYDTVVRILPRVVKLINEDFPEKSRISDRIKRANIFTVLKELELADRTEDFKLVPKE